MKIYYYRVFMMKQFFKIIKTYDLGFFFLTLYKAKKETLAPWTTLKRDVTNSMTFATKSSNQIFIIFVGKMQAIIVGYKD